ncbi:MAG: T9SS type A sorting domain-containing protein [Chitinispirillaceae bacterium]|nr:T9SS type A sorting domain-containing protein [Chitinispirillaceae bacterium]
MEKRTFFLLLLPSVLTAAAITKTYHFPAPTIRDGKIVMDNTHIASTACAPSVAVHAVKLLVPRGNTVVSCSVEYSAPRLLNGTYEVRPAIPPTPKSHGPVSRVKALGKVYVKNEFFPSRTSGGQEFTIQYTNGIPLFYTTIFPTQYNTLSHHVRYYESITVKVETAPAATEPPYYCTPALKSALKSLVENPEAVANLPLSAANPDDYEYMIVCKTAFADAFGEFVKFNTRRGMRTKIFTVDNVKSFTGANVQEKLRNLIKQEYIQHHIRYVLIASNDRRNDATCVPHRGFWSRFYDHDVRPDNLQEDDDIPADMYYACLDGDWKTDKAGLVRNYGFWGTEDIGHEVFVGRFCVNTAAQLANMINKTIKYSEQPVVEGAINNVMLAGEFLWNDFGVLCTGTKSLANLKGTCTANNFTTCGFPENVWKFIEVSHEKNPNWQDDDWAMRDSLFYSGIARQKCAWVNHSGHASTELSIGTVSTSASAFYQRGWNPVLADNKTFRNCDGTTSNYFFFTSGGCYSGAFDNYCPPGGGIPYSYSSEDCWAACASRLAVGPVAMIAHSRFAMGDNDGTDGGSDRPIRWLHDAIFNPEKKIHYVGQMLANAKETDAKRITLADVPNQDITKDSPYWGALKYCYYELNIFGDPALSLWTAPPAKLTLQPTITNNTFTLDTKGPYSCVSLLNSTDSIFITTQTGIDGICTITDPILTQYLATDPTGVLKVKVKAHNYLPDSATVGIVTGVSRNERMAPIVVQTVSISGKSLHLHYAVNRSGAVRVAIYNANGRLVMPVHAVMAEKGSHAYKVPLNDISSGVYYFTIAHGSAQATTKFCVAR